MFGAKTTKRLHVDLSCSGGAERIDGMSFSVTSTVHQIPGQCLLHLQQVKICGVLLLDSWWTEKAGDSYPIILIL